MGVLPGMLIFLMIVISRVSYGASMVEDLNWFKNALNFSKLSDERLESYMNPLMGKESYRLTPRFAPWAGNYFPMAQKGVAQRWQSCTQGTCELYTKEKIIEMTPEQVRTLSPIEKYDLLLGDYEYSSTRHELASRGPQRPLPPEYWEGFCNGVRCAGLVTQEPEFPVTLKNKDGVVIRFEPADIKALLGANYFYVEKYGQIGSPTKEGFGSSQPNAAVFDLAIRYYLGLHRKGFVIDSHLGPEIWNETVVGYTRELDEAKNLSQKEKAVYPQAAKKIRVRLSLETLGEVDINESNGSTKARVAKGEFLAPIYSEYDLFVDSAGKVVDGRWSPSADTRGIDFAWFARGKGADDKYAEVGGNERLKFRLLEPLIKESHRPRCSKIFGF